MRRRLTLVAVLAAMTLTGALACSAKSTPQAAGTTAAPTTAAAVDETTATCVAALAESKTAAAEFSTQLDALIAALVAGDDAKSKDLETKLRKRMNEWQVRLTEWSNKTVKASVKTVLVDAAATVKQHNNPDDEMPANEVKIAFADISTKLTTACA